VTCFPLAPGEGGGEGTCFGIRDRPARGTQRRTWKFQEVILGSPDRGLCHHGRPNSLHFSRPNMMLDVAQHPRSDGHFHSAHPPKEGGSWWVSR
jgi:hypothetical protein